MRRKRTASTKLHQAQAAHYEGLSRVILRKVLPTNIPHRRAGSRVLTRKWALDLRPEGPKRSGKFRDKLARLGAVASSTFFEGMLGRGRRARPILHPTRAATGRHH